MIDKEKIKTILELFLAWNGETEVIDVANLDSAVEFIEESLQKEPISEDLEEFINTIKLLTSNTALLTFEYGCRKGANWQKEKDDEEKVLIYKRGFEDCKEQMLAKAVDGEVTYGKSLAIPSLGYRLDKERLDFGDKVKVIIIKKD